MSDFSVSEVQILPVKPKDGLLAFVSFILNDYLFVGNVALYSRPDGSGFRLLFPSKTLPNGKIITIVHPITKELGEAIHLAVTKKFEDLIGKSGDKFNERASQKK